jgi:hypothetical protein
VVRRRFMGSAIMVLSLTKIPCGVPHMPFPEAKRKALVSRSRPCLSLANEIRRCTRVQVSTVRTLISKPRGEAARSLADSGFSGSPSFVAVMQPTDLRYRHDGPHFRRLNRSWLR